jgi:hypothetical protein
MLDCSHQNGQVSVEQLNPPVGLTRDRQLAAINLSVALFKWDHGMACNLKEVAVVSGYHYAQVRRWDLPLFEGKITRSEFLAWKRKKMARRRPGQPDAEATLLLEPCLGPATAARQRRLARREPDELPETLVESIQGLHEQNGHE